MQNNLTELLHCRSIDPLLSPPAPPPIQINTQRNSSSRRSDRKGVKEIALRTNSNFEQLNQRLCEPTENRRIHGKVGVKRTGGKVVLVGRKQKMNKCKENRAANNQKKEYRGSQIQSSIKLEENNNPSMLVSIKSYQSGPRSTSIPQQDNLIERPHPRNSNCSQQSQTARGGGEAEDIFKQFKRRLAGDRQLSRKSGQKKNCFFSNLKRKLQVEIRRADHQSKIDRISLLIEGCNVQAHTAPTSRVYLQQRSDRSSTAGGKLDLSRGGDLRERPRSCRSGDSGRALRELRERSAQMLVGRPVVPHRSTNRQRNTTKESGSSKMNYAKSSMATLQDGQQAKLGAAAEVKRIIDVCEKERGGQVNSKMRVFEYYCRKMEDGFARASRRLQEVQSVEIDD